MSERRNWTDTNAIFREITSPLRHARFILGFDRRSELDSFIKTVLEGDPPTIFSQATLRYGIWDEDAVEVGLKDERGNTPIFWPYALRCPLRH